MKSPLCYIGGKSQLAAKIVSRIPKHKTYCEVFSGAAWVFFAKEPSKCEILNDLDGELIAYYRVLQNHLEEFLRQFKWMLSSRELFGDFKRQQEAGGLTDIQRAARYYYLQRHSFGGKVSGRTFGSAPHRAPRINLVRIEEELSAVYLRLTGVTIEHCNWATVVDRYDRPETFFYLDPPYFGAPVYKHNFYLLADYEAIAERLTHLKGRFILSINDVREMRTVFSRFKIEPVTLRYTVDNRNAQTARELFVTGN